LVYQVAYVGLRKAVILGYTLQEAEAHEKLDTGATFVFISS